MCLSDQVTPPTVDCSVSITQYPYFEGFESRLPQCWENIDRNGDALAWGFDSDEYGGFAISRSWYADAALNPDNWLITPKLKMGSSGSQLEFWVGVNSEYPNEHLQIMVSTTNKTSSSFTTVAEYNFTAADTWVQKTVDLSAYNNQTIYLAFVHNQSTDNDYVIIDDIEINTQNVSSINEFADNSISIYPNPATNVVTIDGIQANETVTITDLQGRTVLTENSARIHVSGLPGGFYFVKVGNKISKFIKK
ncbi:MAG: choice-of-anchor J domain-containing protein [Dysgonamonadaceae bacterium]|jgi:hypothetical protein|nr:choice-of-anchor J domain-containing protein [Dysgonamonadaceae bacterium]